MQTLASVAVAIAAAGGEPLSVTPISLEGDPLPGGATVVEIAGIDVNSAGSWVVTLDTDDPDPHADELIVHDGTVVITEGDFIGPDGGYVTVLGAGTLNDRGDMLWPGLIGGVLQPFRRVVVFNGVIVAQSGVDFEMGGLSDSARVEFFAETALANGPVCAIIASISRPVFPIAANWVVYRVDPTDASATLVIREGTQLPGQTLHANIDTSTDEWREDQ